MSDEMREGRGGRFDDAIDRAVREMIDVEPPGDLRARVIGRIERPAPSGFRWAVWLLAPVAAAALVILLLLLWLPSGQTPPPVVHSAHKGSAPLPIAPVQGPAYVGSVAPKRQELEVARVEHPRISRRPPERVYAATADDTERAVAPLDRIAPIRVAAVTQSDITPQPISIEPLAPIDQVQIAPLTPPDGRY